MLKERRKEMRRGVRHDTLDVVSATREQFEIIDQLWDAVQTRQRIVFGVLVLFAAAGGWGAWFVYRSVSQQQGAISRLNGALSSRPAVTPPAPSDPADLAKTKTEIATLREKVTQLESSHQQSQARLDEIKQELIQMRQGAAKEPVRYTAANMPGAAEAGKTNPIERVDFEITQGHSKQLTPGISLGVTRIDRSSLSVDGWMWIMPDRRTIWVHGRGAQQQVVFYAHQDGKRRELVISQVGRDSVGGYLLVPKDLPQASR